MNSATDQWNGSLGHYVSRISDSSPVATADNSSFTDLSIDWNLLSLVFSVILAAILFICLMWQLVQVIKSLAERIDRGSVKRSDLESAQPANGNIIRGHYVNNAMDSLLTNESTPRLWQAVDEKDLQTVLCILTGERTVYLEERHSGQTPLQLAAMKGYDEIADALLQAGANPYAEDQWGYGSPMFWACRRNHPAVVRVLLDVGVLIGHRYGGGATALHCAACEGSPAVVRFLLERGADASLRTFQDEQGNRTPLEDAIFQSRKALEEERCADAERYEKVVQIFEDNLQRRQQ